jgi:hypothetical protein
MHGNQNTVRKPVPAQFAHNITLVDRPCFCLAPGCARGPGGVDFHRESGRIRHCLAQASPGYFRPFCPAPEHRYPRLENLQRRVFVHHAGVQMNSWGLREVLEKKTGIGRAGGSGRSVVRVGGISAVWLPAGVRVEIWLRRKNPVENSCDFDMCGNSVLYSRWS